LKQRAAFCLFVLISLIANAQTINLGGVVSNTESQPIANSIVTLARQAMKDTTGPEGKYSFAITVAVKPPVRVPQTEEISINNGVLQFILSNSLPVKVAIFDVKGNLLKKEVVKSAAAGAYRFDIKKNCQATNLLIINVTIGKREVSFPYMMLNSGKYASNPSGAYTSPIGGGLALPAAVLDTLKVTATGYLTKTVTITSYDNQQQDITLDFSASWPAIMSAIMFDGNADLVPDTLRIALTDTFKTGQRLDSVVVVYRGQQYSRPAASVSVRGPIILVPFTMLNGTAGRPSGVAMLFITVDGDTKSDMHTFTDGVCPALIAADVLENDGTQSDILFVTFSESVNATSIVGKQLLLIKTGTVDTVTLTVTQVTAKTNDSMYMIQLAASDPKVAADDRLRLQPESAGGSITDSAKNKPHDLNRSVIVGFRAGTAALAPVWYLDANVGRSGQPGDVSMRGLIKGTVRLILPKAPM
jgi:hypothetical protein